MDNLNNVFKKDLIILDCTLISNGNTNLYNSNDTFLNFIEYFKNLKSKIVLYLHYTEFVGEPFSRYNPNQPNSIDIKLLDNVLVENDVDLFLIYGGHDCLRYQNMISTNKIKFYYWSTFLLHYTYYSVLKKYNSIPTINKNFDKLFITFNNKPKQHRGMLMDYLYKNDLLKYGTFTWNELTNEWSNNFKFKYWEEKVVKIDITEEIKDYRYDFLTDYILNSGCFLNIVGETLDNNDMFFITEKTYKNLLFGQPFVCIGSPYQNIILKKYGFELYDEIMDYRFDEQLRIEDRVDMLINNIQKLKNENYNLLYKKIEDKIEYNKKRAFEIIKQDTFVPDILVQLYKKYQSEFLSYNNSYMNTHEYLNKIFSFL